MNHMQRTKITFGQKLRLDAYLSKSNNLNWSFSDNCSGFTRKTFNYVTGMNLRSHAFMSFINTPKYLGKYLSHYGIF